MQSDDLKMVTNIGKKLILIIRGNISTELAKKVITDCINGINKRTRSISA